MFGWLKKFRTGKKAAPAQPESPASLYGSLPADAVITSRFCHVVEGRQEPHLYGDIWQRQQTSGPERLVIAPDRDHTGLMLELASLWHENYYVLYVLLIPPEGKQAGRYQSPDMGYPELRDFCKEFGDFIESDGRHSFWINSPVGEALLVYDHHNLIYAYGDLARYEHLLEQRNFVKDQVKIPVPHSHIFLDDSIEPLERLMARYEWRWSELHPDDDP
jgi:hypothetical protein